jgi:hypothetical protein
MSDDGLADGASFGLRWELRSIPALPKRFHERSADYVGCHVDLLFMVANSVPCRHLLASIR